MQIDLIDKKVFETPSTDSKAPAILLIDCSGSTLSEFNEKLLVFDKMLEVVLSHAKHDTYRIVFWNADYNDESNKDFPKGVLVIPYIVKQSSLKQPFLMAKLKMQGNPQGTMPALGFKAIPKEWIDNKEATHIYFVTDGEISKPAQNKKDLAKEIRALFEMYNNIHLHILTVEAVITDYKNVEKVDTIAGGDVYQVIKNECLTSRITEFRSWCQNQDAYTHISNVIAPPGFLPFGREYFSETNVGLFIKHLFDLIGKKKDDEEELLKIIQNLSATLKVLLKDKPMKIQGVITTTFCDMFIQTVLDPSIVKFILVDTIQLEQQGKAMVFSEYRTKLKNLYKQANDLLIQDTKNAIGLSGEFMTFPLNGKIIIGHSSLVCESITLAKNLYPCAAVKLNNEYFPALPTRFDSISPLNQQCLRQYTRAIIATQYKVNPVEDIVIYIVLGLVLKVILSDVSNKTAVDAWRHLGRIMLLKKRLNTDTTELARLQTGELPTPNSGKIEHFYQFMDRVGKIIGISCRPLTLWYAMCLALGDNQLATKQLIHCSESILGDFGREDGLLENLTLKDKFKCHVLSIESTLDYTCIITLEDTSSSGGWRFSQHQSLTNKSCCPNFVLSQTGYEFLLQRQQIPCPVCYQSLTKKDMEQVKPKDLEF